MRPLPQWSTIALAPPQRVVTATLRGNGGSTDVTQDHTVASLRPLTIAAGVDAGLSPLLEYTDAATGDLLGFLRLRRVASFDTANSSLALYEVAAGEHCCLPSPHREWNAWLQNRAMSKNRSPHNAGMAPIAAQQLMIAYLCPRPVVLVSVAAPDHRNIFPMDLIGPLQSEYFSLALRSTNVSAPVLRAVRRAALSSVPATMKDIVYRLSAHHRQPPADWAALSFAVRPSTAFGIPAVAEALRIRELAIERSEEIGSHTFFIGRIVAEENLAQGLQLHHTAGLHQAWRRRRGDPFAEV